MKTTRALAIASTVLCAAACDAAKSGHEVTCGDHGTICIDAEDMETAGCLATTACWWHCAFETNATDCSDTTAWENPEEKCSPSTDYLKELQDGGYVPQTEFWYDYTALNDDVVVTHPNGLETSPGAIGPICIHQSEDPDSYLPEYISLCEAWLINETEYYNTYPPVTGSCDMTLGPWPDNGFDFGEHIQVPNKCKKKVNCYAESSVGLTCEQQGTCCQQFPAGVCEAIDLGEPLPSPIATTQGVTGTLQITLGRVTLNIPVSGHVAFADATSCSDPRGCPVFAETIDLTARNFQASTAWGFGTNVDVDRFHVALAQPALGVATNAATLQFAPGALLFDVDWKLPNGKRGDMKWRLTPEVTLSRSSLRYGGSVSSPRGQSYSATLSLDILP